MKNLILTASMAAVCIGQTAQAQTPATTAAATAAAIPAATGTSTDRDEDGIIDLFDEYPGNENLVFLPPGHGGAPDLDHCPVERTRAVILKDLARCAANQPNCGWEWMAADGRTVTCKMVTADGYAWSGEKLLGREEIRANRLAASQKKLADGIAALSVQTGEAVAAIEVVNQNQTARLDEHDIRITAVSERLVIQEEKAVIVERRVDHLDASVDGIEGDLVKLFARAVPYLTVGVGAYGGAQTPIGYQLPDGADANEVGVVIAGRGGSAYGTTLRLEAGGDTRDWRVGFMGDISLLAEPTAGYAPLGVSLRAGPTFLRKLEDWSVGVSVGGFAHFTDAGVHASSARAYGGYVSPRAVFPIGESGRTGVELGGILGLGTGGGETLYRLEDADGNSQFGGVADAEGMVVEGGGQLLFTQNFGGRAK